MRIARRLANTVPEVTVSFWIIKVLATTVGDTAATFALWYRSERTVSIHTITTTRRGSFYWAAILFTFALGTAAGGLLAERINLGYLPSAGIFAAVIAVIAIAFRARALGAVLAFWTAYVLTRPLGASLGDWLSQPRDNGGLGLGTVGPSVVFLLASVAVVAYLTRTRVDVPEDRSTAPAPINAHTYR